MMPIVKCFLLSLRYFLSRLINSIFTHSFILRIYWTSLCVSTFWLWGLRWAQAWSALVDLRGTPMYSTVSLAFPDSGVNWQSSLPNTNVKLHKCPREGQGGRCQGFCRTMVLQEWPSHLPVSFKCEPVRDSMGFHPRPLRSETLGKGVSLWILTTRPSECSDWLRWGTTALRGSSVTPYKLGCTLLYNGSIIFKFL